MASYVGQRVRGRVKGDVAPAASAAARWFCNTCSKSLCSKRSYKEHMNTHTNSRPYQCESCSYAAASQMTLRRHVLRNHKSREEWGYQCPYCTGAFMEPASYQHHVMTQHFGHSGTFGCPESLCNFTTLCARHFRDHIRKHQTRRSFNGAASAQFVEIGPRPFVSLLDGPAQRGRLLDDEPFGDLDDLSRFLVDDELGNGWGKQPLPPPPKKPSPVSAAGLVPASLPASLTGSLASSLASSQAVSSLASQPSPVLSLVHKRTLSAVPAGTSLTASGLSHGVRKKVVLIRNPADPSQKARICLAPPNARVLLRSPGGGQTRILSSRGPQTRILVRRPGPVAVAKAVPPPPPPPPPPKAPRQPRAERQEVEISAGALGTERRPSLDSIVPAIGILPDDDPDDDNDDMFSWMKEITSALETQSPPSPLELEGVGDKPLVEVDMDLD